MFNPDNLQILSRISITGFLLVLLIGLVMAFNPRSLMVIPVIVSYLSVQHEGEGNAGSFSRALAFVLGMTFADVLLGVLFALIGKRVGIIFGPRWEILIGIVLIVLGLRWLNVFKFRGIGFEMKGKKTGSIAGAFFLGIPFSMSFCPFCTPVLLTILTIAAATGHVWYSALLMLFFSIGRGLPLLSAGLSVGLFKKMEPFQRYVPIFEKAGGVILLIMGTYYVYDFIKLYAFVT